ncbi:MAG: DNA-directed polymerase subunit [Methanothermococcus sp.]|jgi:DNA-directed RNA polymerase subunit E"|uniref:transcription elongation factor subunit Spt4 n=1 Tax=Methanothermococcus TaxID=155862 RepID=UPI0003601F7D|nr:MULTISPECIES: transcription elongation factor subunit Spt4 [Methanothermococcus]MDK2790428.1 DNA-directed polymerase subunit [Methanothermococcus sp.]MDK2987778.1 DNA-directed polymerase subunit [Methanothermococcus sp.]
MRACLKCKYITKEDKCPLCEGETSENWRGLLIILDPVNSEVAKKAKIDCKGKYALSVK